MYCIQSAATISHQPSFANPGFSSRLSKEFESLIKPDYKEFVPPALIRRMSDILRMAVASSNLALKDAGIEQPDAIITGTGLGCLYDTEKFLNNAITIEGGLLPLLHSFNLLTTLSLGRFRWYLATISTT